MPLHSDFLCSHRNLHVIAFFHNNGQNMVDCARKYYHLIKHDYLIQIILKQL